MTTIEKVGRNSSKTTPPKSSTSDPQILQPIIYHPTLSRILPREQWSAGLIYTEKNFSPLEYLNIWPKKQVKRANFRPDLKFINEDDESDDTFYDELPEIEPDSEFIQSIYNHLEL